MPVPDREAREITMAVIDLDRAQRVLNQAIRDALHAGAQPAEVAALAGITVDTVNALT